MIAPARRAAYDILRDVDLGRSDLATAAAAVRAHLEDSRDRALASEIATGVLRWQLTLDYLIAHFAKRPLNKLDPEVVAILRIGAYQLLHLTRVPAAAVVDDAVKMTRLFRKGSASGFVNGVLRALSRSRGSLPLPEEPSPDADTHERVDYFSTVLSHPRWLVARWLERLGDDVAEQWMRFNNAPAPLTLRTNRLATDRPSLLATLNDHDIAATAGRFAPDTIRIEAGSNLRSAEIASNLYVVQDEASQLVTLLAGNRPGQRVLDTCAAPGGKTTALAALYDQNDSGMIVACDVRDRRMALLAASVRAAGADSVRLLQADLLKPLPFQPVFDTVLVDAPCSGLGTLRRDPDIKWRRQPGDLPALSSAQSLMLAHAAAVVAPGGRLIYATCSTEPEENERVSEQFLQTHGEYRPIDAASIADPLKAVRDERGHLRTTPDQHGLEGFFGAVFERTRHL